MVTTLTRVGEIVGTSAIALATSAGVVAEQAQSVAEVGQSDWMQVLVPIGIAAIVGYFTSRITTESRLSQLESEVRSMRNELRIYYQRRGGDDD